MKGYDMIKSGGVIRIVGIDVAVMIIEGGGDWALDSGEEMSITGWEIMGVGNNGDMTGSITGDDVFLFLVRNRRLGRDFAFFMMYELSTWCVVESILWFGVDSNESASASSISGNSKVLGRTSWSKKLNIEQISCNQITNPISFLNFSTCGLGNALVNKLAGISSVFKLKTNRHRHWTLPLPF